MLPAKKTSTSSFFTSKTAPFPSVVRVIPVTDSTLSSGKILLNTLKANLRKFKKQAKEFDNSDNCIKGDK
jgi:hypothetical protein